MPRVQAPIVHKELQKTKDQKDSPSNVCSLRRNARYFILYFIISIPFWSVSAEMAPVACAIRYPSASIKYVVGNEYTL